MLHQEPWVPPVMCVIWQNHYVRRKVVLHMSISEPKAEDDVSLLLSESPFQQLVLKMVGGAGPASQPLDSAGLWSQLEPHFSGTLTFNYHTLSI